MWKGDPYLDPQSEILYNRLGLSDQAELDAAELKFSARTFAELMGEPLPGGFDQKHLQAIHRRLFEKVYFQSEQYICGEFRPS
jgi:cell filamentation protein